MTWKKMQTTVQMRVCVSSCQKPVCLSTGLVKTSM